MEKQEVISIEELKQGFCSETMKQGFLWSGHSKNQLDDYLKTRKERDLLYLVYSLMNRCDLYFKKWYVLMICGSSTPVFMVNHHFA